MERRAVSGSGGEYSLSLPAGTYRLRVSSPGFAPFEQTDVVVAARRTAALDVTLSVAIEETKVNVEQDAAINTSPDANAGAVVLKDKDLKALPDDRTELEAALQALAGPSAGPSGGEIFIEGFSGGRLPPRNSIREIRI